MTSRELQTRTPEYNRRSTMKPFLAQTLKLGAASAFLVFGFTGCMTDSPKSDYATDGESALLKQEAENMGTVLNSAQTAAGKIAADTTYDTLTSELVITPIHFDSAITGWVRTAQYTGWKGFERQREDTVYLEDSAGNKMGMPFTPRLAARVIHIRHVTRINPNTGKEVDLNFNTVLTWAFHGDSLFGVWNGTIDGTFNGNPFKQGTITNVERPFTGLTGLALGRGVFGVATSGTISIQKLVFDIEIEFLGGGDAKVTVTNTVNHKVHILNIDRDNVTTGG